MMASRLLLAAGLALLAAPLVPASHNVCHRQSPDADPGGPAAHLVPGAGGGYLCVGPTAVGVDETVYAGPSYGATVRVITCSGLACSEAVGNTGVVLVPSAGGPACVTENCYAVVTCIADSTCP